MKLGKKRCWKGCKPVPGKKPYSKGSCSCGMDALTPGMIEFAQGQVVAGFLGIKNAVRLPKSVGFDPVRRQIARNVKEIRKIDGIKTKWPEGHLAGDLSALKAALQPRRARFAKATKEIYRKEKRAALAAMNSDSAVIQGSLGSKNYYSPLARKTKQVRASYGLASLTPGMIEFDPRPRNDMGQYVGNETMGVDPNSMAAAYGNVEQEKMMRRRSLVQRMKAMMGRPQEQPMM